MEKQAQTVPREALLWEVQRFEWHGGRPLLLFLSFDFLFEIIMEARRLLSGGCP